MRVIYIQPRWLSPLRSIVVPLQLSLSSAWPRKLEHKGQEVQPLNLLFLSLKLFVAGSLQTELLSAAAAKGSAEQELAEARLANERAERASRQEIAKLQTEIAALRQRLDRADAESLHSRRENLRLAEQISSLEKEVRE